MDIREGDLVAFNTLPDAVWFEVISIKGYSMCVCEAGTQNAVQYIDSSLVKMHQKSLRRKEFY